jgi:esterase/lipase superfamily enzyme
MKHIWTLLLSTLVLAGCQPPVRLMPTPEVFLQSEINPFRFNPAFEKSNEIEVFYATNRVPLGSVSSRHYTVLPSDDLSLGVATLNIGGGPKTWEWLYQISTTADPHEESRPPLILDSMHELAVVDGALNASLDSPAADAFFAKVNAALDKSIDKDLMVYVHGANTSVERAAGQAAQYRHFTGRNSVVLFFAWPSAENFMRYATDVANARRTEPKFARLLELLSKHTKAAHINVLAYSAGAMVASPGLARLDELPKGDEHPAVRLGEIYHAAPDANFRDFSADLPRYVKLARRVTFSANMGDSVLTISRMHQRTGSRAGRPNPNELSAADSQWLIETSKTLNFDVLRIEPANIPGMSRRSHNFWFGHPWVSTDVLLKFWFHAPPVQRGLQENSTAQGLQYWTFPADYDKRLEGAVRELTKHAIDEVDSSSLKAPPASKS